eukprot:SAG22_NODE_225_length_14728_cov_58.742361_18_plen_331_part_00
MHEGRQCLTTHLLGVRGGVVRPGVEALGRGAAGHAARVGDRTLAGRPPLQDSQCACMRSSGERTRSKREREHRENQTDRVELPDVADRARLGVDVGGHVLRVERALHLERVEARGALVRAVVKVGQASAVAVGCFAADRNALGKPEAGLAGAAFAGAVPAVAGVRLDQAGRGELAVRPAAGKREQREACREEKKGRKGRGRREKGREDGEGTGRKRGEWWGRKGEGGGGEKARRGQGKKRRTRRLESNRRERLFCYRYLRSIIIVYLACSARDAPRRQVGVDAVPTRRHDHAAVRRGACDQSGEGERAHHLVLLAGVFFKLATPRRPCPP